jgi:hypothetical protein
MVASSVLLLGAPVPRHIKVAGQRTSIPVAGCEPAGRHRRPSGLARRRYAGARGSSWSTDSAGQPTSAPATGAGSAHRGRQLKPVDARRTHQPRPAGDGRSMSALVRIADSTRTSRDVRDVPEGDILRYLHRRLNSRSSSVDINQCSPLAGMLRAVPDAYQSLGLFILELWRAAAYGPNRASGIGGQQ